MMMQLAIGKQSDGSDYLIPIAESNLFVSYVEKDQIEMLFGNLLACFGQQVKVFLSASALQVEKLKALNKNLVAEPDIVLLEMAYKELKARRKAATVKAPVFILIEDIWSWVLMANKKGRSTRLTDLLTIGPEYQIFMICASAISLRNLLTQLIDNNPKLKSRLTASQHPRPVGALGAELIYTAEDFVYYKKKGSIEFERLY
ncbi:MAG TPA: hypothetical protein PKE30_08030 [Niabella sp.]|nr:hypothetical protein [Niabella sp.]